MLVALGPQDAAAPAWSEVVDTQANQASSQLVASIDGLLQRAGAARTQLTALACGTGPGTFTGSRVAVATAMGLAVGLGLPIYAVSTLAGLAASGGVDGTVWALLDARRGEVYGAPVACDSTGPRLLADPRCSTLAQFVADHRRAYPPELVLGRPVEIDASTLPCEFHPVARVGNGITAAGLWSAARRAVELETPVRPHDLRVTYLRESYAEMGLNRPKRPVTKSPFV
ncbi:MAG: tRNA (adenosine(37)-N6)-threonylcarbamoyltransferase complex dimerization subunit type 1 TsaB [Myxococcales bacterium FL481]|nr:MAG: tRNA (adenosine(37)-N6)-threonylcarbamoyltransferase complex dimerization subunit type 1 TsaB [Myxococcales bacterium FL481]